MPELPTGTVTFLFTDLEGSTRLWQEHPEAMKDALARHDEILRVAITAHDGHVVKMTGDGAHAAFADATSAVRAARDAQVALAGEEWGETGPLRVRMGVHTGPAEARDGDYYGTAVNRAARLMSASHGGQVVVSLTTQEVLLDAGAGVDLADLGEHRLRDLSRAERVFQLRGDGIDQAFPPLRSLEAVPGNLPAQLSSFVGREDELRAVAKEFERSRLVTLTGVGGVGKTRLSVQAAAEIAPRFPEGVWFCELAAATDTGTLLQVVAATVGAAPRPGASMEDSIIEFLASRRVLLVLDNCEHLLDAAGRLAERLLQSCPDVRILATSREGLAVEGERVRPLRSLASPDTDSSSESVLTYAAPLLFAERAEAARPGFLIDAGSAATVVEICRRLDGIPLAIELAAARVAAMTPAEIAGHLDERFRLLTGGRRTAVERHQTLRATMDWSYSLLAESERTVFDRLGVFAGSFDAAAATAVAGGEGVEAWDVIDALGSLVSKSLVDAEDADDGTTRYQLLETMRQYARERLDERSEADPRRLRHAEYFAEFAEVAGPGLLGPDEFLWRARLTRELDNLRAALTWSLDSGNDDDGELAVRIVGALAAQATLDRVSGLAAWAERTRERAERSTPERRVAVIGAAAWDAVMAGDYTRARALGESAADVDIPVWGTEMGLGPVGALALAAMYSGEYDEARRLLDTYAPKISTGTATDRPTLWSVTLATTRVIVDVLEGRLSDARAASETALMSARRSQSPSALALALYTRGWALMYSDPDGALASFAESVALVHAGATDMLLAHCLARAAALRGERSDPEAVRSIAEAVAFAHDVGSRITLMGVLDYSVDVLVAFARAEAAAIVDGALVAGRIVALNPVEGPELERRERSRARGRDELGSAEYDEAFARGAAMEYDELLAYLRAEFDALLSELTDA
ncbi:MAG TPA: adenylate/guanylate cyclase domain-containing protein [Acidimicrobiia bacterium]|nr:adenylate/guanylate cyclase domain-containing protein [Acidimicrobiia bacterium]